MAKAAEPRNVPDVAVVGIVVVRVEPQVVKELAAAGAAVVVVAPAVHPHDEPMEPWVRIQALAPPALTRWAAHESRGDSVRLTANEPDQVIPGGGPSALRRVAEDATAAIPVAEKRFEAPTALRQLRGFEERLA